MKTELGIAVSGASGRMGQAVILAANTVDNIQSIYAIESADNPIIGSTAIDGTTIIHSSEQLDLSSVDVLIDFTTPTATLNLAKHCAASNTGMVIGTTGLASDDVEKLRHYSQTIPILAAQNMSIGVNVMYKLAEMASALLQAGSLDGGYDIEIFEAHHKHKKDAPSGTALRLGETIANATAGNLADDAIFTRPRYSDKKRQSKDIGFSVVRAGDIVGEHRVIFAGAGEQIEILHRSTSRGNYAAGALRAAQFIASAPPAFYDDMMIVFNSVNNVNKK